MPIINLLPPDLTPKKSILKFTNILVKVSYTSIILLLTSIIIVFVIFFINITKIRNLEKEQTVLLNSVKEYEQTEQQITLAKDRMSIMKEIWGVKDINSFLGTFEKTLSFIDEDMTLKSSNMSSNKSDISLESTSANSVSKFMGNFITSGIYSSVSLTNFSFNPNTGYRISLESVAK